MDFPNPNSSGPPAGAVTLDELMVHSSWVRSLARTLVKDPSTAEDLVQETWLAAIKRPPRGDRPLRPWLAQVLRNFARMHMRSESSRSRRQTATAKGEALPASDELVQRVETQRGLAEHVLSLEEPDRSIVILRYYEGLSSAEIARRQGIPAGTVRWRLSRAHGELRERLDREHGDRRTWCLMFAPLSRIAPAPVVPGTASAVGSLGMSVAGAVVLLLLGISGYWIGRPWGGPSPALPGTVAGVTPDPPHDSGAGPGRSAKGPVHGPGLPAGPGVTIPTATLRLRAVNSAGRGIAGAWLSVDSHEVVSPMAASPQRSTTSDSEGWLEWTRPGAPPGGASPRGGAGLLTLRAPGHLERVLPWHPVLGETAGGGAKSGASASPSVVDLGEHELVPYAKIEGRVLDGMGQPRGGMEVGVEVLPGRWAGMRRTRLREARYNGGLLEPDAPRAFTDGEGRFRFAALEPGYVRLWVVGDGEPALDHGPLALEAGAVAQVGELQLPGVSEGERLVGRVLDPEGRGVAFAEVEWSRPSAGVDFFDTGDGQRREGATRVRCDEHGAFEGIVDPSAALELVARDSEGNRSSALVSLGRSSGLLRRCDLTLDRSARVSIRFESNGEPEVPLLEGAFVLARGPRIGNSGGAVRRFVPEVDPLASTDTLGFSMPRPLRPTTLELRVAGGCLWSFNAPSSRAGRGQPDPGAREGSWRFPLTAEACESVEVCRGVLEPMDGGAWVSGVGWTVEVLGAALRSAGAEGGDFVGFRTGVDGMGRFELVRPDPGRCWIRVIAKGEVVARAPWPEDGSLRIRVGRSASLSGHGGGLGRGAPGTSWVGLQGVEGRVLATPVDAEGNYRFEGLVPGPYRVGWLDGRGRTRSPVEAGSPAGAPGSLRAPMPWLEGQSKVQLSLGAGAEHVQDLSLRPTAELRLTLLSKGASLGPWQVQLSGPPGVEPRPARIFDPMGAVEFGGLEPGAWAAKIWPCEEVDRGVSFHWDLVLEAGREERSLDVETTDLVVMAETPDSAAPSAGGDEGTPWPDRVLEVELREGLCWRAELRNREGPSLRWDGVPAGVLRVFNRRGIDDPGSRPRGASAGVRSMTLEAGGTTRVDAEWVRRP